MSYEQTTERFSLLTFLAVNLTTLAVIFGFWKIAFPTIWQAQLATPWYIIVATFILAHLVNAFIEYFFHRYVLHAQVFPFFSHFYKAHNLHHEHTKVERQNELTSNKFPIVEDPQHESSFFPWYSLIVFAIFLTPVYVGIWMLFPAVPIFIAGYTSLLFSIALYELFHVALHWPLSRWTPLFQSKRFGKFWKTVYTFHLRHHANVRCNESISGFFGLPIPDLLFGTYLQAKTLFPDQTIVPPEEYRTPRPGFIIRTLDNILLKQHTK